MIEWFDPIRPGQQPVQENELGGGFFLYGDRTPDVLRLPCGTPGHPSGAVARVVGVQRLPCARCHGPEVTTYATNLDGPNGSRLGVQAATCCELWLVVALAGAVEP